MNNQIVIDLDGEYAAPMIDASLLNLVNKVVCDWPEEVTCATQEIDGEILLWSANIEDVRKARVSACKNAGLMPEIGIKYQVDSTYYEISEQAYVATDWDTAVVSKADFQANLIQ
ncbi:hypothetical protein [Alteromonas gilva]|uniref:Uncharacterized protein n=1 Tax=Alteromonas gilva TaxID=2987522 RepID=A0ABT5L8P7_9ALTE|nr:hypothetical protein [Alteromonas gilva]MDC8832976.1 hypothetical protein [Alteromonas gilva]